MWHLSSLAKEQTFAICKCFALQSRSLTTRPPRKSLYLPFNTYYMFIILVLFIPPIDPDFHFVLNSFWLETFYKTFITLVCWWWYNIVVVVCMRKYFILFLICIFLGYRILSQLYFSQHLRSGASVLWLTLFHLPNLLSSSFFVLLCLFFLLVTFLWLILKPWIMMCLCIVVIFLILDLIELLC